MTALDFHSHKTQLIATAVAASLATAGLLSAYTSYSKRQRRKNLNEEIFQSIALKEFKETPSNVPTPASRGEDDLKYDEDLIKEQLARNYAFFGEEGMSKLRGGNVVVVGCGGVGSWAAVMLVRS
jgi:tRNA threonylcarbamoyladenosine dehydratase